MPILNQKPLSVWIIIIRDQITDETYTHYQAYESSEKARTEANEIQTEDETIICTIRKIKLSPKLREQLTTKVTNPPPEPFYRIIASDKPIYGQTLMEHHYPQSISRSVLETLYELERLRIVALHGQRPDPKSTLIFDLIPADTIDLTEQTCFKHPYDPAYPKLDKIPY